MMIKAVRKLLIFILIRIVKLKRIEQIILRISSMISIDLIQLSHYANGIMKYHNSKESGEDYLLNCILRAYFINNKIESPIIFDVGANIGDYSVDLKTKFPSSKIFAFEPNPYTFHKLAKATNTLQDTTIINVGLGATISDTVIYSYKNEIESQHASLLKDVFTDLHYANELSTIDIHITTIDNICSEYNLPKIDFLKIDTEGYELEVLKGASKLISERNVNVIQFEFNEMNIISRVFLKDFYDLLADFNFFRLDTNRLIVLTEYNPINEIFRFQNLLAVRKGIKNFNETSVT